MTENAELLSLRRETSVLRSRVARLQTHVDVEGRALVNRVTEGIVDASTASAAIQSYDHAWFATLVYSPAIVRLIAQRLIDAVEPYPFIDASHLAVYAQTGTRA